MKKSSPVLLITLLGVALSNPLKAQTTQHKNTQTSPKPVPVANHIRVEVSHNYYKPSTTTQTPIRGTTVRSLPPTRESAHPNYSGGRTKISGNAN